MAGKKEDAALLIDRILEMQGREVDMLDKLAAARFAELVSARMAGAIPLGSLCESLWAGKSYVSLASLTEEGVVLLRGKNITPNHLDDSDTSFVPPDFDDKSLLAGDILVRQTGRPGVACIVLPSYTGSFISSALVLRLRGDCGTDAEYVCGYINSALGKDYLSTCAQRYLSLGALAAMPIVLLRQEERDAMSRFCQTIADCKRGVGAARRKLQCLSVDNPTVENRGILRSSTVACTCEVLHSLTER